MPDIRERNDRPKDKQPKHRTASTVQRQIVQKFVKKLNDSAKQSERSDSAEHTATEQVETTAREIAREAVQLPRRAIQHPARKKSADSSANAQPEQSVQPHHAPESKQPQSTLTPAPQEQARRAYVRQTAKAATTAPPITPEQSQSQHSTVTAPSAENALRTRPEAKQPRSVPTSMPQEQGRRAYVQRAKKSHAEKSSARDHLHTGQPEIRFADDMPQSASPPIREKPDIPENRGQVQSEAVPAKPSAVRHVKQSGAWTPRKEAKPTMHGKEQSVHERPAVTPAHDLPPTPQAQAREIFVEKQAQLPRNPSIESIYPPELAAPVPPQLPVSEAPAITPKRQPLTAGSSKSASPVQPPPTQSLPVEQPPAIREKPKPSVAPREKSWRGVSIRTIDTEQISTPKVQPKTPASKTAAKRARKSATQDAQRKMLQKRNNRAIRAAAAAAKKLVEAAAKAVKEPISALASLGGGTALFVVFSIVIVAGAFLASPLGILFADEQESEDTVPLATAIAEIQGEYHAELERLQNGDYVSVQIIGQAPDWREVVAVFASKTAGAADGVDVFTLDEERVELLRQVFWDMCEITTATQTVDVPDSNPDDDVDDSHTEIALTITITAKTAEQMRLIYAFTKYQNDALDVLLENLGSLNIPMGSLTISQEDAIALLENLPGDLVFYPDDSHVGIVGSRDADGNLLIVHCSGGANGVVITGSAGFTSVARPDCFAD